MSANNNFEPIPREKFRIGYLKPAYWGTWLYFGFLWLVMWLPRTWIMSLGRFVGDKIRTKNAKRRHIAEVNIRLCFPQLSDAEQAKMLVEHFRCYGCGLVDMGLIMMGTKHRIRKFSEVKGFEHIQALSDTKKGILVTFHTTTLDMCSSSMFADLDVVSMMNRDKNPLLTWFLHRGRTRSKRALILMRDESLRGIIEGLNQGRVCYFIPDEDFGDGKHSVFAPFFGQQRSTLNIVSRVSKTTNAVVMPCISRLDPHSGRYYTEVSPPLENFPSADQVKDATAINQAMEKLIMAAPEQYLWTFRWFRTRPDGKPNPYLSE